MEKQSVMVADRVVRRPDPGVLLNARNIEPRTYVVLGVARGGTTMAAGALQCLGVSMGEGLDLFVEDRVSKPGFQRGWTPSDLWSNWQRLRHLRETIAERNRHWGVWGFKSPSAYRYLRFFRDVLDRPFVICPVRNPLSVTTSLTAWAYSSLDETLLPVIERQRAVLRAIQRYGLPAWLYPVEWATDNGEAFVEALAANAGLAPGADALSRARAFVTPGGGYQPLGRVDGWLDICSGRTIAGWVAPLQDQRQSLRIEVRVDGTLVWHGTANRRRPDVVAQGRSSIEACGYHVELERPLKRGQTVTVRCRDVAQIAPGSPVKVV